MLDPTNARVRTIDTVFGAPRVPIKSLPAAGGERRDGHDDDQDRRRPPVQLTEWNAYVGPPF
jgi:hypothetical protein